MKLTFHKNDTIEFVAEQCRRVKEDFGFTEFASEPGPTGFSVIHPEPDKFKNDECLYTGSILDITYYDKLVTRCMVIGDGADETEIMLP
jgi:hypothetical protein